MSLEIQTGEPHADGRYLCYVENEFLPAFTDPKILMHHKGEWFHPMSDQRFRGHVFGWVFIPIRKVVDFACKHEDTSLAFTGDGAAVETCLNCGEHVHVGKPPREPEYDL